MDWTYIYLALIVVALIGLGYGIYRMVRNRGPAGYEAEQADL
jgi:F0F1-type ATP synthase assembly protein I